MTDGQQICFHLPFTILAIFCKSQKPLQTIVKTFHEIEDVFENVPFPSTFSNAILYNAYKKILDEIIVIHMF